MVFNFLRDNTYCAVFVETMQDLEVNIKNFVVAERLNHLSDKLVTIINPNFTEEVVEQINLYSSRVIFHNLTTSHIQIISKIKDHIEIIWVFYGSEIFDRPNIVNKFLTVKTIRTLNKWYYPSRFIEIVKHWAFISKNSLSYSNALNRVDFIAQWIIPDFNFIKNLDHLSEIKRIDFCYPSKLIDINSHEISKKDKVILLGNSAVQSNNHFDGLDYIIRNELHLTHRIVCNIGSNPNGFYITRFKKHAIDLIGERIEFVEKLLPYNEYLLFLSTVDIAIFPHLRSQAGVNVRTLLYNSKTVVLFSTSNLFKHLSDIGLKMLKLEEAYMGLSKNQRNINRAIISKEFGENRAIQSINNLISKQNSNG